MCLLLRVYIGVGGGWEKLDWRGNDCGGAGEWLWRSKREDRVGGGGGGGESHDDCCLKSWLKRSKVSSGHLLCRSLSLYIYVDVGTCYLFGLKIILFCLIVIFLHAICTKSFFRSTNRLSNLHLVKLFYM